MTIAAGFVHQQGILLCADSQLESPGLKTMGMKLGSFKGNWGVVAAAIAGNVDYATAALHKLERELFKRSPASSVQLTDLIETTSSEFYGQHVLAHPQYQYAELGYSLLLAVRSVSEQHPTLYVTNETVMRPVGAYRCEGIGRDVGHSVLKRLYHIEMDEHKAMRLASYMLARVKQNVPGCEGPSMFVKMALDGTVTQVVDDPELLHIENVSGWFDQSASEFLLNHTCDSDDEFQGHFKQLGWQAMHIRTLWKELKQGAQPTQTASKHDPSAPQPSPESPGGSDAP